LSGVRGWLLLSLTVGLAASITLSETTLVVLAIWLVLGPRPASPSPRWPLLAPLSAFAGWTVVAVLASARPMESLLAARGLLTLGAFYVVLYALPDARAAGRFARLGEQPQPDGQIAISATPSLMTASPAGLVLSNA